MGAILTASLMAVVVWWGQVGQFITPHEPSSCLGEKYSVLPEEVPQDLQRPWVGGSLYFGKS